MGLRKSIKVLQMNGSVAHDPGRYAGRTDGPECPESIGNAPRHLSARVRAIWDEIISQIPEGMLRSPDRMLLEITCKLMDKYRSPRRYKRTITKGDVTTVEWAVDEMQTSEITLLTNSLGKLGLNPIDRSKVKVDAKKPDVKSPWDEL